MEESKWADGEGGEDSDKITVEQIETEIVRCFVIMVMFVREQENG